MGILSDALIAWAVHGHNRQRNRIKRRMFDFVPDQGNIVICGGGSLAGNSLAADIKFNSFIDNIIQAAKLKRPTVCIYSEDFITPDILNLLRDDSIKDNICFFGHTHSYIPFDKNVEMFKVERMMSNLISSYQKDINSYNSSIRSVMAMLLNVLENCLSNEYYTYTNLAYIVSHLIKKDNNSYDGYRFSGEDEFLNWLYQETNLDVDFYENQLTINWNTAITEFFGFWKLLNAEVEGQQSDELKKRSVYSCLLDKKVCIFKVSPNYNQNLIELLLNELAFYKDRRQDYTFISYNVDLSKLSKYQLLDTGRSIIIGNTLHSIGMKDYNPPRASFISLGITSEDAVNVFQKMVSTGWWTQVDMGFGRHSHMRFAPKHQEPITPDVLVNVNDGSAYIIDPNEYRYVDRLFV